MDSFCLYLSSKKERYWILFYLIWWFCGVRCLECSFRFSFSIVLYFFGFHMLYVSYKVEFSFAFHLCALVRWCGRETKCKIFFICFTLVIPLLVWYVPYIERLAVKILIWIFHGILFPLFLILIFLYMQRDPKIPIMVLPQLRQIWPTILFYDQPDVHVDKILTFVCLQESKQAENMSCLNLIHLFKIKS